MVEAADSTGAWIARALSDGGAGAWHWDLESDRVVWSDGLAGLLGVDSFSGTRDAFLAIVHPVDREQVEQAVQGALEARGEYVAEFRVPQASGAERWFEKRGCVVCDDAGQPIAMSGLVREVSDRRAAQDALIGIASGVSAAHGEGFLRSLVERLAVLLDADLAFVAALASPEGHRVRTVVCWADGAFSDNFEYDLEGTPCADVVDQELTIYERDVQDAFPDDTLLADLGVDGYAGSPIFDTSGAPLGLLVVLWRRPVPKPRIVEAALQIFGARAGAELVQSRLETQRALSTEMLRKQQAALGELSRSEVWQQFDRAAAFKLITEVGARTLGVERVGIWLYDASRSRIVLRDLYQQSADAHESGLSRTCDSNPGYFRALRRDRTILAHNGATDPRTTSFSAYIGEHAITSLLDAAIVTRGRDVGVVCFEHVGKAREWSEEESSFAASIADFCALAIELENRRSLEQQLVEAQKMESIGRLAGGVAHDFNNLLTAMSGSAELAKMSTHEPTTRVYLDEIIDASERAAELTNQLLAFARKQVIEPRVVNLNDVVTDCRSMIGRLIGADIELRTELTDDLWLVSVDPSQIQQILINLAVNARDAMPTGGRLVVSTAHRPLDVVNARQHGVRPGDHVLLSVSDSGTGIDPELLPHLFEPFFTTKEQGKGTGLGLATCYGIVRQAGGHIVARNKDSRGAVFEMYLPRALGEAQRVRRERAPAGEPGGQEVILLVEDDDSVRRMASRALTKFGYQVLQAANGAEALESARTHHESIGMIVLDIVMPDMTGHEVADQLQQMGLNFPILLVSGYTEDAVVRHGMLDGEVDFLQKPFSLTVLAARVREILDRHA